MAAPEGTPGKTSTDGCKDDRCAIRGCWLKTQRDQYVQYSGKIHADGSVGGEYYDREEWSIFRKNLKIVGEDLHCPNTRELVKIDTREFIQAAHEGKLITPPSPSEQAPDSLNDTDIIFEQ